MKPTIITIAGALGSGKSSTARRVAEKLGYKHFSSGDLFRAKAHERGVTIEEINHQAELEHEIDKAVDEELRRMGDESHLVIDSRLAFHWIPHSFKVYLALDPKVGAARIHNQIITEGRKSQARESVDDIYQNTLKRLQSEKKRFNNLYNIDPRDTSAFDLVVDTETNNLDQVVETVLTHYNEWLSS